MHIAQSMLDVLVIGAGQAGLALGYHLKQTGMQFQLVDRYDRIGDPWRRRFDSLTLFTPRAYSALPGLPVPGDPDGYPTKDEIADYLEAYARHFSLPVTSGTAIQRLERDGDRFRAVTSTGDVLSSRFVVLATGAFQQPAIPAISRQLAPEVVQLTPETYRNPVQTPPGTVLVVGDGATGRQIARELSDSHRVLLSTGRPRRVSPNRVLGKSLFWWLDKLGILRKSRETRVGQVLMAKDPFPGKDLELSKLEKAGISIVGRLSGAAGRQTTFGKGRLADIDAVIWATGYRDESDWVAIPEVKDANGTFIQNRGISPVPGLMFIGRSWQWTRGSALLTGVGADAERIVSRIVASAHEVAPDEQSRDESGETVPIKEAVTAGRPQRDSEKLITNQESRKATQAAEG